MTNLVTFSHAMSDRTRWRIVNLVMTEALCVCELADILKMPQSSVSSHVQIIRKAQMLESERCGKWTYFCIEPRTRELLAQMTPFFPAASDPVLASDAKRAEARLKKRASSCCPGPQALATAARKANCNH